jgi:hypothetical protein
LEASALRALGTLRSDPWLRSRPDDKVFFCGEDVYEHLTEEAPLQETGDFLASSGW